MIKLRIKYGNSQTNLRFPCTEKEMRAALGRIHAENITPLELYAAEVVFPEELSFLQDRFVDLDEVNFLAKRMDSFFGDEEYRFYEALKSEGFDTVPDLINLSFNLNRYPLIQDISDMGKIGREYLLAVNACLPADDADDPKYAAFGRKLIQSGNGVFTEHGLFFIDKGTPFERVYDGRNFPPYVYEPMLCFLRAEYNGKTEYLYLPCEDEAIDKAFARLGAPTPDVVELSWEDHCIESEKWVERFKEIASEEGVYKLNRLVAAVNGVDMEKLWAVAEYAEAEDARQLARLAKNIDCFTVVENTANYSDVGRYVVDHTDHYAMPLELEKYFDFGAFGEHIAEEYYGKFVGGNFIYNDTGTSLLDILYQDEPMTISGMQM